MPIFLRAFLLILVTACFVGPAVASIDTNPPQPITRRVQIQPIVVTNNAGGNSAVFFSNDPAQTSILNMVDRIWAQAGIVVLWQPEKTLANSTYLFLEDSDPALDGLAAAARTAGVWDFSAHTINAFFVKGYAGFSPGTGSGARGTAFVGENATYQTIGLATVNSPSAYESAAKIISHEIGHSLGLTHHITPSIPAPSSNVMFLSANANSGEDLAQQQIIDARSSQLLATIATPPAGDFNEDNLVNALDLSVWQSGYGKFYPNGDSNFDGDADGADFLTWQRDLRALSNTSIGTTVPEPSVMSLAILGLLVRLSLRRALITPR